MISYSATFIGKLPNSTAMGEIQSKNFLLGTKHMKEALQNLLVCVGKVFFSTISCTHTVLLHKVMLRAQM